MTVSPELLRTMAERAPTQGRPSTTSWSTPTGTRLDLQRLLSDSGIEVHKTKLEPDGRTIHEVDCLTSSEHSNGAFFTQFPDGGVDYSCHHNSCGAKGWQDVKPLLALPQGSHPVPNGQHVLKASDANTEPQLIPPPIQSHAMPAMDNAAYYGLAGDIVRAVAPTTEADPVAVLITFLTFFGNACGRGPHLLVGDSRHGTNLFNVLVGETSQSRKGTSQDGPLRLMGLADEEWRTERVQGGLSSGEGLIWAIHDDIQRYNAKTGVREVIEPGVTDKRLLCIEEELSQVLKTGQRQGATISENIRRAWDSRTTLQIMTKTSPTKATDPHISILGHITKAELSREITETDLANGLANRFGWFRVRRAHLLPDPVRLSDDLANELGERIRRALVFAKGVGVVSRDADASGMWNFAYHELERDRPGLAGAITARASPITLRIALIYALLDSSRVIRPEHLEAALSIWDYAEASVMSIFGDLTGDAIADRILAMLQTEGQMTRNDLYDAFGRNVSSSRIGNALDLLHRANRIRAWRVTPDGGKGRPRTVYEAVNANADSKEGSTR